jgi:four helix bundle protein
MARLQDSLLARVEEVCDRVVHVAEAAAKSGVSKRLTEQLLAAGTSVGANAFEADEAMSRADFVKCLSIACKELNETHFWLRLFGRHNWVSAARLSPLIEEVVQVKKVLGAIIARTKKLARSKRI